MNEFEAAQNPKLDYFEHASPTGRSKYDIGRYVQSAGLAVPLIDTLDDIRRAATETGLYIRSDGVDEYDGPSGLRRSHRLAPILPQFSGMYPKPNEYIKVDGAWVEVERLLVGCDERTFVLPYDFEAGSNNVERRQFERDITKQILSGALYAGEPFGADPETSSLWRHVQGDNISMMRDPVQPDLYHFKWGEYTSSKIYRHQYEDGYPIFRYGNGFAKNLQRRIDGGDRLIDDAYFGVWDERAECYGEEADELLIPDLWAPIHEAIDMYETVRTLPLFDQRQVPVMEMQYSREEQRLYFLQYLKTGRLLQHLDAFPLPTGDAIVQGNDVVGATAPEGDTMRIYLGITGNNMKRSLGVIQNEGVMIPFESILDGGGGLQALALQSRMAMVAWRLTFHNHHFGSAMFTRTPLSIGLSDWQGVIGPHMEEIHYDFIRTHDKDEIGYINAKVTSNGREVVVESDWQTHVAEAGR